MPERRPASTRKMPTRRSMPTKRTKAKKTLGGALSGALIGLVLIVASPWVLWEAEGQHRASDFKGAELVENATDVRDGYVTVEGGVIIDSPLQCAENSECLYYQLNHEELITRTEEQCGDIKGERLEYTGQMCDEDGYDCEDCYMVEVQEWEVQSTEAKQVNPLMIGAYDVDLMGDMERIGMVERVVTLDETHREVWNMLPNAGRLLATGYSNGGRLEGAGEQTFVVSTQSWESTLAELNKRDSQSKWMFRLIAFAMVFAGFGGIFGVIGYFTGLAAKVPFVGRFVKEGANAMIGFVTLGLSLGFFLVEWIVIMLARNVLVTGIVLLVLVAALFGIAKLRPER